MRNRVLQVGVAAVLVFGVLAALHFIEIGTTSVAWGELGRRVGSVRDFVFKVSTKATMSGQAINMEMYAYQSARHGIRMDTYQAGRLQMMMYMPADDGEMVTVMPDAKQYIRMKMTPEYMAQWKKRQQDPRDFVKWFTTAEYTSLGRSVIDGIEAEGIEARGSDVGGGMFEHAEGRLWVNPATQWPIRMEIKGRLAQGMGEMELAMYGFEWDKTLEPGWYVPVIPEDYTQQGSTMTVAMPSEETMLHGLKIFAELSGGKYPASLSIADISAELGRLMAGALVQGDVDKSAMQQKAMDISQAGGFFIKLVTEKKDPEYFGRTVTAADADKALLRWKSSPGKMKVVYGDLSIEEVADVNEPAGR